MALTKVKAGNILLTTPGASSNDVTPATTAYVTTALANLADSAPSTLNTLNELAAALGDDANFSTTVTNSIATKLPLAGGTLTGALTVSATTATINITGGSTGASLINLGDSDDGNVGRIYYDHTDNFMQFKAGDAERMRIDSSGKVGIGTTSPLTPLHVVGANGLLLDTEGNGDGSVYFGGISGTDRSYIARSSDDLLMWNVSAGNLRFGNNNAERMRIESSGQILITNDTPSIKFVDSGDNSAQFIQAYGGYLRYYADDNNILSGSEHSWWIDGTRKMTLDSTGRLAVGGTATSGSTGGVTISSAGSGYRHMYIWNSGLYFWNGSNEANLSSGGAWNNASDERLKENITDISYGLAEVKKLKPKKYNMIAGGELQVGLIAQEVETIIPEVVTTSGEANMKSLSYGNLNAVLIKAIQELEARITILEG